ncbi:carboxypeptidase regulatory-like domain-containing protein [Granulicella cerasi]|uniref:Carboxypeptidase regulatory-like domain-containing protein n=1 Tax=Granulicella cerasi TaxID=741063 RepID=A0ABW1ZC86_9BACT|nr:carboxypeptidase regulatory-like domain-containing protein [Granulicella cerasi]
MKNLSNTMRRALRATLFVFGAVIASALMIAQVLYGNITGIVTDPSGAAIPGASVKIEDVNKGLVYTTTSGADGSYSFKDLTPGTFKVTVMATGFTTTEQKDIPVLANASARINAQLKVGGATQEVSVSTAPPVLQTESAESNYNISTEQMTELPTTSSTGRNFQSLYKFIPGSTPPAEQNSAGGNPQRSQSVNVNGISNSTNTTRIDGAIDAYPWLAYLVAYVPPPDAIETVNAVTGSFNAEQGAAGGSAINIIMRSGTNKFHGSVWEYNSISQFNARAWSFRTGALPKNIYNEVGGSIGGPILKDKLFFFVDYNRVSVNKAISGVTTVPTQDMRNGNFNGTGTTVYDPATGNANGVGKTAFAGNQINSARFAPAAVTMLANLPLPNYGTVGAVSNNYFGSAVNKFLRENYDGKLTYVPTQKTSFFGHYSNSPNTITDPQIFGANPGGGTWDGGQPGKATGRIQNVGLGFTHAFTSNFSTDWNAGYTRQNLAAQADDLSLGDYGVNTLKIPGTNYNGSPLYGGIPGFYFSTFASLGNANTGSPFTFKDNQYTANANASWAHGHHAIRFGGEYLHAAINHNQPGSGSYSTPRGSFIFSGGSTAAYGGSASSVNSFASFLLGQAENYQKSVQTFNPEPIRWSTFSFYAQDTWQATSKLTINYGVRYEYYPLAVGDHFGTVRYDPTLRSTVTDSNGTHTVGTVLVGGKGGIGQHAGTSNGWGMIVPRIGISYRANEKTVVRAGFGITTDPDTQRQLLQAYPAQVGTNIVGASGYVPATSLNTGLLSPVTQVGIPTLAIPDITAGYLPLISTLSTTTIPQNFRRGYIESYNLAVQRDLGRSFTGNIAYVGTHAVRQITSVNINAAPVNGGNTGRLLNTLYGANTNNTDINSILPFRGSVYHGLQTQLTRMSPKHASTGVIYTFSKAMDISDNSTYSGLTFAYPTDYNRNWGLAGYDRKHNFQWWTVYNLPFGKGQAYLQHGAAGYILGNWRVSTALSYVSGVPLTVTATSSYLNAPGSTQVADRIAGVPTVLKGRKYQNGGYQYINPAAFADVTAATSTAPRFGNSSRGSVRGPGYFNLDASLKRSFPIYKDISLDFMAESFNVTNTPNFSAPATAVNTPSSFGVITAAATNRTLRLSGHITF